MYSLIAGVYFVCLVFRRSLLICIALCIYCLPPDRRHAEKPGREHRDSRHLPIVPQLERSTLLLALYGSHVDVHGTEVHPACLSETYTARSSPRRRCYQVEGSFAAVVQVDSATACGILDLDNAPRTWATVK